MFLNLIQSELTPGPGNLLDIKYDNKLHLILLNVAPERKIAAIFKCVSCYAIFLPHRQYK